MLTSLVEAAPRERPAYRSFRVQVARVERLAPHFTNVTFAGDDLEGFGTAGLDQRVKVVLPLPEIGFAAFPDGDDWYGAWRELPAELRNPFRTYTVRAVRPHAREVDIVFVGHGDGGPASAWAATAAPGDEIVLIGPDELSPGRTVGIDWRPGVVDTLLLAGDETAAPAIASILESLPADAKGIALIEVPADGDRLPVRAPAGVEVRWLSRADAARRHGDLLVPAVRDWVVRHLAAIGAARAADADHAAAALAAAEHDDLPDTPLWDVPEGHSLDGDCYAWLAGEASAITTLRRFLVREAGLDRRQVAFMGYWRLGRAELD
ncbi:NADPH-dependent ferric siderophore reductase [Agromyces sp. 3263]|uniref:siderophore-interacting protein n=1 Tax=Agromyces sp. 3263 TaxID=2817750 RepID=UPI00285ED9AA|nr:siderophore-interacting protein [Agromyces sp. 3263]MDR6904560.1 NADPH-dependent ferric siderophore reductase [Agromyces sp. 3263]